ncbi:hypothetical protein BDV19DRAFT_358273 [Aspergillus venezuelensis]
MVQDWLGLDFCLGLSIIFLWRMSAPSLFAFLVVTKVRGGKGINWLRSLSPHCSMQFVNASFWLRMWCRYNCAKVYRRHEATR